MSIADSIRNLRSYKMKGHTWERYLKPTLKWATLIIMMIWILLPLYWVFQNSLKSPEMVFSTGIGIPWVTFQPVAWEGKNAWRTMWSVFPFVEYLMATFVVSFGTAALATVSAITAAYSFARLDYPFKNWLFLLSVTGFIFPLIVITVPIYVLISNLGLLNTYLGMVLAFTAFTLPYNIWLLRGFFEDLPDNLEESARINGCTQMGAFYRVILPISRPAIATVFLLAFLLAWHNFLMAAIVGEDALHTTLSPAIIQMKGTFYIQNIHFLMAAVFLTLIFPMIMYMYLQKYLTQGLSSAGR